jgi:uncharacterized protein
LKFDPVRNSVQHRVRWRSLVTAVVARWALVACGVAVVSALIGAAGVPSPTIFGGLFTGMAVALACRNAPVLRPGPVDGAQALVGVLLGLALTPSTVAELGSVWAPVAIATLLTPVLCLSLAAALFRFTDLDPATAVLASIPGGAIGVVAMARELRADERMVAFSQYLRVLFILLATPLVGTVFHGSHASTAPPAVDLSATGIAFGALLAVAGWRGARRIRLPAAALLGPMFVTAGVALLLPSAPVTVPEPAREVAFALMGLDVGLRFTREAVARALRLLPALSLALVALLAACGAMAVLLTATSDTPMLDSYLAMTPGGLSVVAATAYGAGADTALIAAIQTVRLLFMLAVSPLLVGAAVRRFSRRLGGDETVVPGVRLTTARNEARVPSRSLERPTEPSREESL